MPKELALIYYMDIDEEELSTDVLRQLVNQIHVIQCTSIINTNTNRWLVRMISVLHRRDKLKGLLTNV